MDFGNCAAAWSVLASFGHTKSKRVFPNNTTQFSSAYRKAAWIVRPDLKHEEVRTAMSTIIVQANHYLKTGCADITSLTDDPIVQGPSYKDHKTNSTKHDRISTQEAATILRLFRSDALYTEKLFVGTKNHPFETPGKVDFSYWPALVDKLINPALNHTNTSSCGLADKYCKSGVLRKTVDICVQALSDIDPAIQANIAAPTVLKVFPSTDISESTPEQVVGTKYGLLELSGTLTELGIPL